MSKRAVADTGPLVAIVRDREEAHARSVAALKFLRAPLLTCWPVLTEAAWLLRGEPGGMRALGGLLQSGAVKLVDLDELALAWMVEFRDRYSKLGAQIADGALVNVAETGGIDAVFTLDRRELSVYRTSDGRSLAILPDPA